MKKLFFVLIVEFLCGHLMGQDNCPITLAAAPRLFHIQRTGSPDTIVYDANTGPDGLFYKNSPVTIYWRRTAQKGQKEDLNYLQRTQAYGLKFVASSQANEYSFHLVSYPQRNFYLKKDDCGQPVAVLTLSGKEAYLQRIFIQMEPALFGLKPNVHYIEIFGVDVQTGNLAYEKFVP